jgi:hypothetical protein
MHNITFDQLRAHMTAAGHRLFMADYKPYNLNLIAIRSASPVLDEFNDLLCIVWQYRGIVNMLRHTVTTDPGLTYLGAGRMENPRGTAVVKAGQYPGAWAYGWHKGYRALQQVGPITVLRDPNRDGLLNPANGFEDTGLFGINCHRAAATGRTSSVGPWSAGCIVHADADEFGVLMEIVRRSVEHWPNQFTFTLLEERNFAQHPNSLTT